METIRSLAPAAVVLGALALAGCEASTSVTPTAFAARPGVQIDQSWQTTNGQWTFTGHVDPEGQLTDVVLEVGPGPVTARAFDRRIPVAQDLTDPGPLTITTRDIPDSGEICVRFTATNNAGSSSSTPLCFPHDLPSIVVDAVPPTTAFSAPAVGTTTVLSDTSYTVLWTETDASGISRRSLQRRVATDSGGACGAFENDGPASAATSPVAVSGLLDGTCYQWIETLSDNAGNTSATTSGTVRVDIASP